MAVAALVEEVRDLLLFSHRSIRPGSQSVLDGVEVRALSKFFRAKQGKPFLYGPGFVHGGLSFCNKVGSNKVPEISLYANKGDLERTAPEQKSYSVGSCWSFDIAEMLIPFLNSLKSREE